MKDKTVLVCLSVCLSVKLQSQLTTRPSSPFYTCCLSLFPEHVLLHPSQKQSFISLTASHPEGSGSYAIQAPPIALVFASSRRNGFSGQRRVRIAWWLGGTGRYPRSKQKYLHDRLLGGPGWKDFVTGTGTGLVWVLEGWGLVVWFWRVGEGRSCRRSGDKRNVDAIDCGGWWRIRPCRS